LTLEKLFVRSSSVSFAFGERIKSNQTKMNFRKSPIYPSFEREERCLRSTAGSFPRVPDL